MTAQTNLKDKRSFKIFDQPISMLGFGGSLYTSLEQIDALHDFKKAMICAFDSGINHFDTAQSYNNGQGEFLFSECIKNWKRDRFILASKMMLKKSKEETIEGVNTSLKSLSVDYLDVFYIHWPLGDTDPRPMMEGLEECRTRGVIKGIGVSNFSIEQLELLDQAGNVDIVQFGYNLLWRKHEEDLIPYCIKNDIGMISYSSLLNELTQISDDLKKKISDTGNIFQYYPK